MSASYFRRRPKYEALAEAGSEPANHALGAQLKVTMRCPRYSKQEYKRFLPGSSNELDIMQDLDWPDRVLPTLEEAAVGKVPQ